MYPILIYCLIGRTISCTLVVLRSEWTLSAQPAWENIFTITEKLGKQHIGFSICISQSVGRTFLNFAMDHKNKVQDIVNSVGYSKYENNLLS